MKHAKSILTVCLNPTFEKTLVFDSFYENEVNRTADYFLLPAGKGINVAREIKRHGFEAAAFTHLGGSRTDEFLQLCGQESIKLEYFIVDSPIRSCINIIHNRKRTSTKLVEESLPVDIHASKQAFDLYISLLNKFDAVVITGTKTAGYADDLYPKMVKEAKNAGKLVVLDICGTDLIDSLPFKPDIIKPNLSEFMFTFENGCRVLENQDTEGLRDKVCALTENLYARYGTKSIISRGKFPLWVYDGHSFYEMPNIDVPVVNTIGCGDALTAGLTLSLLDEGDLKKAVIFGMDCAAQNAQKLYHGLKKDKS
ncbi:carbohydrate kinase [Treponema sp. OMZ 840]|uniref:1-phosphofructokinase family hexose kinase n=1 Tax=Treponema sp. OMZ 840 TaxID=244313 RepID=UPI003D8A7117